MTESALRRPVDEIPPTGPPPISGVSYNTPARPLMLSPKRERKVYDDRMRSPHRQSSRVDSTRLRQPMMQRDDIRGSAQNLMGMVLESEGLNKYVDAGYLQHELSEATGLSNHELDVAAHELMAGQSRVPQQTDTQPNQHRQRQYSGNII